MQSYKLKKQLLYIVSSAFLLGLTSCGESRSTTVSTPTPSQSAPAIAPSPSNPTASSPSASPNATASTPPTVDSAGTVALENGRVTFKLPPGFTPMTAEEINFKFPPRGANRPQYVYANPLRNVAIAVTFSKARLSPQQLPELKTVIRKTLGQAFPNADWKSEEMTTINNTSWAHLEFVSQAIDTKVHNDTYFTSFDGKLLGFNFNSTVEQYEGNKSGLQRTRDSIVVR